MTVEEIKEAKEIAEEEVKQALYRFMSKTDSLPFELSVERHKGMSSIGGNYGPPYVTTLTVNIQIRID